MCNCGCTGTKNKSGCAKAEMQDAVPMQEQIAFKDHVRHGGDLSVAKRLTQNVLSLPIHTEMEEDVQEYIIDILHDYLNH